MKILIAGAGAVGSVFGGLLSLKGHAVTLLGRGPHIEAIQKNGIEITGIWGHFKSDSCRVWTVAPPLTLAEEFDMILICVKSYDTSSMLQNILPCVSKNTCIVSLQNGLNNYETILKYISPDRILMGRVIFGVVRPEAGKADVTVYAEEVRIGSPDHSMNEECIFQIAGIFSEAGIPTLPAKDIMQYIWDKVLYNSSLNPLSVLRNCTYGELLEDPETREMMCQIVEEIYHVAGAKKVSMMEKSPERYVEKLFTRLIPSTAAHRSSMLQDILNGRRTEIDALNGAVLKMAYETGISVPVNEMLTSLIKAKEAISH